MYTTAIFIAQDDVAGMLKELKGEMARLKEEESAGRLRFVSLGEAAAIWQDLYAGEGYVYIP